MPTPEHAARVQALVRAGLTVDEINTLARTAVLTQKGSEMTTALGSALLAISEDQGKAIADYLLTPETTPGTPDINAFVSALGTACWSNDHTNILARCLLLCRAVIAHRRDLVPARPLDASEPVPEVKK